MSVPPRPELPENFLETLNAARGGYDRLIGLRYTRATYDEVTAEVPIGPDLLQPYGLVHGGVYASIIESVASTGAAISALAQSRFVVGLENTTSFLRAARGGTLFARATPLTRGRRSHVWQVEVSDGEGRVYASGRVRLLCLEAGSGVGGETLQAREPAVDPEP